MEKTFSRFLTVFLKIKNQLATIIGFLLVDFRVTLATRGKKKTIPSSVQNRFPSAVNQDRIEVDRITEMWPLLKSPVHFFFKHFMFTYYLFLHPEKKTRKIHMNNFLLCFKHWLIEVNTIIINIFAK